MLKVSNSQYNLVMIWEYIIENRSSKKKKLFVIKLIYCNHNRSKRSTKFNERPHLNMKDLRKFHPLGRSTYSNCSKC